MIVTIKLFAILKDRAGLSQTKINLPATATVTDAAQLLGQTYPAIQSFLPRIAFAVNEEYVNSNLELHDGDELALIPPVSGG